MLLPSSGTEVGAAGCVPSCGGCVGCIPNLAAVEEENNPDYSMHTNLNWYSLPHIYFQIGRNPISRSISIAHSGNSQQHLACARCTVTQLAILMHKLINSIVLIVMVYYKVHYSSL